MTPEQRAKKNESQQRYRQRNLERVRAMERASRAAHADRVKARERRYAEQNKEYLAEYKRAWKRANPERVKAYYARHAEKKRRVAKAFPAFGELQTRELMKVDVYAAARRALPSGLPAFVRDDVIADIVIAHLEGKLALAEIPSRAREFLRAHYREFDTFKTVSLDAIVPGTRGTTYLERLEAAE